MRDFSYPIVEAIRKLAAKSSAICMTSWLMICNFRWVKVSSHFSQVVVS